MAKVLNIKNEAAYRLAKELAELKGESLTEAVLISLEERLRREAARPDVDVVDRVLRIAQRLADAPVYDNRNPDEILGYDEHGIWR